MMSVFLGALFLLVTAAIGWLVVTVIFRDALRESRALSLALVLPVGLLVPACIGLISLFATGHAPPPIVSLAAGLFLAVAIHAKWGSRAEWRELIPNKSLARLTALDVLLLSVFTYLFLVLVSNALSYPLTGYDGRAIWVFKSRILLEERTVFGEIFTDPYRIHYHRDYPLLFALSWYHMQGLMGGESDRAVRLLLTLFMPCAGLAIYGAIARRSGRTIALLVATAFCAIIFRKDWWEKDGGAINAATVDFPLSVVALLAFIFYHRYWRDKERAALLPAAVMCGTTLLIKKEGIIILAVAIGANGIYWLLFSRSRKALVELFQSLLITGMIWLPGLLVARGTPNLYDERFGEMFTLGNIQNAPRRIPLILGTFAEEFVKIEKWNAFWLLLPVCWLHSLLFQRRRDLMLIDAAILLWCAAYLVTYCFSPLNLVFHLNTSSTRLLTHILPLVALRVGMTISCGEGQHSHPLRLYPILVAVPVFVAVLALMFLPRFGADQALKQIDSFKPKDRELAAEFLGKAGRVDDAGHLAKLLTDENEKVRKEALRAISRLKSPAAIPQLIAARDAGFLKDSEAAEVALAIGDVEMLNVLELWAKESGEDSRIQRAVEELRSRLAAQRPDSRVVELIDQTKEELRP